MKRAKATPENQWPRGGGSLPHRGDGAGATRPVEIKVTEDERDLIDEACARHKMTRTALLVNATRAYSKVAKPNAKAERPPKDAWPGGPGSLPRRGDGAGATCRIPFRATEEELKLMNDGCEAHALSRTDWLMNAARAYVAALDAKARGA